MSSSAPAPSAEPLPHPEPADTDRIPPQPTAEPGDDGATSPGGPTMILLITGVVSLVAWLRRRRRRRQLS